MAADKLRVEKYVLEDISGVSFCWTTTIQITYYKPDDLFSYTVNNKVPAQHSAKAPKSKQGVQTHEERAEEEM